MNWTCSPNIINKNRGSSLYDDSECSMDIVSFFVVYVYPI
jgi:hypothetical protein